MPEPTTTTSARSDRDRLGASATRTSIQSDRVCSSSTFMAHPSQKRPTGVREKGSVGGQEGGGFQMAISRRTANLRQANLVPIVVGLRHSGSSRGRNAAVVIIHGAGNRRV